MSLLLPQLAAVQVERVDMRGDPVLVAARTRAGPAVCPGCGAVSEHEHSRYGRRVADRGVGGRALLIELSVRRMYCANPECGKATFVEQVPGLTERYQRRTPGLRAVLEAVGVALAGRAGARLLLALGVVVSWMTLLNVVMRIPLPQTATPRALAVDDFALRRGRRYGTLVVDAESRLPIEVWDTRDAEPLAAWLTGHPRVEVVCRDGSHTFRAGISTGAPKAVQVSDRFHLWQGLGRKVYEVVAAHRAELPEPGEEAAKIPGGRAAARARRLHAAVHTLLKEQMPIRAIARHLGVDRNVIRRYARADTWQQAVTVWPKRGGILAPWQGYLHRRWAEGQHNTAALFREIAARGFAGSEATVGLYVRSHRQALDAGLPPPAPARSAFEVSRLLMSRPERLDEDQRSFVKKLAERCPQLGVLHERIRAFADVFATKRADLLDTWIAQVKADGIPPLASYATGLIDDLDAVRNGVALPHSSGVAEGRVTDLKMIKRQMAGRAGTRLLRQRVILVAHSRRPKRPPLDDDHWSINSYENLV